MKDMYKEEIEARWQMLIWRMVIAICIVTFALSWLLFINYRVSKNVGTGKYIFIYIVIPAVIQVFTVVSSFFLIRSDKVSAKKKNYVVTALIFIVLSVIAFSYYTVMPLILLPCIAIAVTALFADQTLTIVTAFAVLVSIIADVIRLHVNEGVESSQLRWGGVLGLCLVFIGLMCSMIFIVNMHTKALMLSIAGSYNRQVTLMSELMTDPMTGLYNRRSFEESLDKEIENVEKTGAKSYVAIFDIDHFKDVNDTYGHSNGDIVIKALCKMMKDKSKDMGLAFRYGGEEFVILFHDTTLPKVMNVVEDIRTEFRCYYFHFMNKDGITCSCGVAEYTSGESSKAWFNRADSALYQAKESGRNRTVISE